jgi:hypothetical protein
VAYPSEPTRKICMQNREKQYFKDALNKMGIKNRQERRISKRHTTNIELNNLNGNPVQNAFIKNLTPGGAKIEIPFAVALMGQIMFDIKLPESIETINMNGRIAWVRAMPMTKGYYQAGIQLYRPDWRIDQWLRLQR